MAELLEKPLEISKDHFLFKININNSESIPGQFANIRIGQGTDPLLRRPFSIFRHSGNVIELIIKIAGKGTKYLRDNYKPGEIDLLAPLGKGFTLCEKKNVLLIGGGVGNAPLHYLAYELRLKNNTINYLYASKSKEYIYKKDDYIAVSDHFYLSTDNGTDGEKGLASHIAGKILKNNRYDFVYTCGPNAMMKSIVDLLTDSGIPVEVSLENYFGCGIGLCYGCSVDTIYGIERACIKGPVFDGKTIKWDSICDY